jgi:hypothetical protein
VTVSNRVYDTYRKTVKLRKDALKWPDARRQPPLPFPQCPLGPSKKRTEGPHRPPDGNRRHQGSGEAAPGGSNPTPDQNVVEDIGRALGVDYEDTEELESTDKVVRRDRRRWELDPASSKDWRERITRRTGRRRKNGQ